MTVYYDDQLAPLVNDSADLERILVKFKSINNQTRWMNINTESIEAIKRFLDVIVTDV